MELTIIQKGRTTTIKKGGQEKQFKTSFLNKLSFKDAMNYFEDSLK